MNTTIRYQPIAAECERAARASEQDLIALAVSRGCRHYAPLVQMHGIPSNLYTLSHEALGCALLRSPMPEGFNAFRCGVMVLSDLGNQPDAIAGAAEYFGVSDRVGYIVRLGLAYDHERQFWENLRPLFQETAVPQVLPGPSRLISETRMSGLNRGPIRVWLRTAFHS
jgi:hypothetical protein